MKQKSLEKWQGQASLGGLKGTHKDFWNNKKQKRKKNCFDGMPIINSQ